MTDQIQVWCSGEGANGDHCCYQAGERCPHLVEHRAGRRYACGLLLKYGTWEAMNRSPEYQPIAEHWDSIGKPRAYCQTFSPLFCCRSDLNPGYLNENQARAAGVVL